MVVGEFTQEADLVVIGGGPGGYSAAFRAAELGVQIIIVDDREALGGVCLHEGCVPSKTLLHVAEVIHLAQRAGEMGVNLGAPKVDVPAVRAWTTKSVQKLSQGLAALAKKHGVEVVQGRAKFEDGRTLGIVGGLVPRVRFRRAVIAVGSTPVEHALLKFDGTRVLRPGEALDLRVVSPANGPVVTSGGSLLVIGSGYMALELASLHAALGVKVTLADEGPRFLPEADDDLVRPLLASMRKRGIAMHANARLTEAKTGGERVTVMFTGPEPPATAAFDHVIVAIGQCANVDGLHLEKTQAQRDDRGFITVDRQMRTTDPRIFAVGDVTGGAMLADVALAQGRICGEAAAGWGSEFDARAIPMAVFTDPNIAWCGVMEHQARTEGRRHKAVRVPWGASGRAVGMGRVDGVTKIIFDPDTQLVLGIGLCGAHAAEMIGEAALAIEMGAAIEDLAATIHAHPSIHELIGDAARMAATADGVPDEP